MFELSNEWGRVPRRAVAHVAIVTTSTHDVVTEEVAIMTSVGVRELKGKLLGGRHGARGPAVTLYLDTSALLKRYVAEEGSLLFCQRRIEPSSGLSIGTGGVPASASDRRFAAEDRHAPRVHRRRDGERFAAIIHRGTKARHGGPAREPQPPRVLGFPPLSRSPFLGPRFRRSCSVTRQVPLSFP